jgi:acyl dehydratase
MTRLEIEFDERPSVVAYMLRACYPAFSRRGITFPPLRVRWKARPDPARLEVFLRATGLDAKRGVPVLYPMVFTFPLQMVILTHPACPLPIWKVLQIRNHMLQQGPIPAGAALEAEAAVMGQRILERGMEMDVHASVRVGGEVAWEGLTTYFYRGRFGTPGPASPLASAELGQTREVARWRTDAGGGFAFSRVSGDYNGIHHWSPYARLFGFRGAFHHPHAVAGQCLARIAEPGAPAQRLDLWLKGPVYYGSEVGLATAVEEEGSAFTVTERDSSRPALVGRWRAAVAGTRLVDGEEPRAA